MGTLPEARKCLSRKGLVRSRTDVGPNSYGVGPAVIAVAPPAGLRWTAGARERAAKWLLLTHDSVEGDRFELTHEFPEQMLGVRRAGVTVAMGTLHAADIVRYTRGRIEVLDRPRLDEASCGCYHITYTALARLLG